MCIQYFLPALLRTLLVKACVCVYVTSFTRCWISAHEICAVCVAAALMCLQLLLVPLGLKYLQSCPAPACHERVAQAVMCWAFASVSCHPIAESLSWHGMQFRLPSADISQPWLKPQTDSGLITSSKYSLPQGQIQQHRRAACAVAASKKPQPVS